MDWMLAANDPLTDFVCRNDNEASRADPARGHRKPSPTAGDSRNLRVGKPCSRRESTPIPAQPRSGKTGLSRRRSRVRVPSLPSLKVPANRHYVLPMWTRPCASWPNPVAQTFRQKRLQNGGLCR